MGLLGINSVLYRNTGSHGSPSWSPVTVIADLSANATWDKADANSRASRIKKSLKTMLGLTFTGNLKVKPGDANYEAFIDAVNSDDILDLLILNGSKDTEGSRGYRIDAQVSEGTEDQAMANALYLAITIDPTDSDNEPQAVYVGAGPTIQYSTPGVNGGDFA